MTTTEARISELNKAIKEIELASLSSPSNSPGLQQAANILFRRRFKLKSALKEAQTAYNERLARNSARA